MNAKTTSIIKALESIDAASLHGLCDDLVCAGALITDLKGKLIRPKGWNPGKHHTIPSRADAIIELDEGLCVLEYSRQENWDNKLRDDVESVRKLTDETGQRLARFIFITTRDTGNRKIRRGEDRLTPEEYIRKEFSQFNVEPYVFGQKDLLVPLRNSDYFYIRRQWLHIPDDYFLSLESFKSYHINQAQDRHIYLKTYVPGTSREESVKVLENFVSQTDKRVLLIHAQGGIGKTRFVLESLKRIKEQTENIDILFNKKQTDVDVDQVIPEISADQKSLIVLDDAHQIENLTDVSRILSARRNAKIILITRSTASESVKWAIGDPVEEMELTPLDQDASIELLKDNLETPLLDEYLRYTADMCDRNPLLIGITAHLINNREVESFGDLKTDDLVRNYFQTILAELRQSNQVPLYRYEPYLALLFLLKPFTISDTQKRVLLRSLVNIDEVEEGIVLRDLEKSAVLERHGDTLWIYPDLLGDHLVGAIFFSDIPILNFNVVFPRLPPSNLSNVFKTLRELDNSKASMFLRSWFYDLENKVESQNNFELCESLDLLEIIAPLVADEALQIIDVLLRPESEKPPSNSETLGLAATPEYRDVLSQCLGILGSHSLRYDHFDDTLERVLRIYHYKPESEDYSALRKEALESIAKTAAYNLNVVKASYGYSIQTWMFERVQAWKQENLEKNFTLILRVCGTLLGTEKKSQYSDYEGISWTSAPVVITDELIHLRRDVISLLQSTYDELQVAERQIEIVRVLNCGTEYPEQSKYSDGMQEMIESNIKTIYEFYLTLATSSSPPEVEVLEEIEQQAHYLKGWRYEDMEVNVVLDQLLTVLQADEWYQLYRTLLSGNPLSCKDKDESPKQVECDKEKPIKGIVDGLTDENLSEWLDKLNAIAEIAARKVHQDFREFYKLLSRIGEAKPYSAQALIDRSLSENNALKTFVAEFIRGIRASTRPDLAGNYVNRWLSSEDWTLILEIPETYRGVDEKFLGAEDVEIFSRLLSCRMEDKEQKRRLNIHIMSNIRWVYGKNPSRATEIICQLFREAVQDCVLRYAHKLRWAREQVDLSQWDLKNFKAILKRFEDLSTLNGDAIYILARYAEREPLGLIQFFERRVERELERGNLQEYRAIPYSPNLKEIAKVYQPHPQYTEAIDQIMGWFQKDDTRYKHAAANLISGISSELDGPLKERLLNLIKSDDEKNIQIVLMVLEKFPDDPALETLCKDAVKYSQGKRKLQNRIEVFILYNLRGRGTIRLKEKLHSWREDENRYVRGFAEKVIRSLEAQNEYDEKWAAEEQIKRKKGL